MKSPAANTHELATLPPTLSVSVVVYFPDVAQLRTTFTSLADAVDAAARAGMLGDVELHLIDNGGAGADVDALLDTIVQPRGIRVVKHSGHGNVGYGRGHNVGIAASRCDYHLVLNPDVIVDDAAIVNALSFLREHPQVGLLTPAVTGPEGETQYLCRDYPSIFVLFLRTACPPSIQERFRGYMDRYELRDRIGDRADLDIPLASGCFMFARRSALERIAGFSPRYFMYFEDHDLSLRLRQVAKIAYAPSVRIVHYGGNTSRKGFRHIRMYVRSAMTFFRAHGWRIV